MSGPDDPYGRRSLFSAPGGDDGPEAPAAGREALFSGAPAFGVRVECSRCGGRRVLDPLALARRLVPSLWWPLRRHSRYLRCPACGHFAWCRLAPAGGGRRDH